MSNKPYDIFGTWFNNNYLLSGNHHWLDQSTSCSVLWLNKVKISSPAFQQVRLILDILCPRGGCSRLCTNHCCVRCVCVWMSFERDTPDLPQMGPYQPHQLVGPDHTPTGGSDPPHQLVWGRSTTRIAGARSATKCLWRTQAVHL